MAVFKRIVALVLLCATLGICQTRLFVFVPGISNIQHLQTEFDAAVGPKKTIIFGRIVDVEAFIAAIPDATIIVNADYLKYAPDYKAFLWGKYKNETGQKYFLVAANANVTLENIAEKKIGIVNFLGRNRLSQFVRFQFGFVPKALKLANKNEDLLTMLGMESVDAVIVPKTEYAELASDTKQNLVVLKESIHLVGFLVCAARTGNDNALIQKTLMGLPASLNRQLRIDKWESK